MLISRFVSLHPSNLALSLSGGWRPWASVRAAVSAAAGLRDQSLPVPVALARRPAAAAPSDAGRVAAVRHKVLPLPGGAAFRQGVCATVHHGEEQSLTHGIPPMNVGGFDTQTTFEHEALSPQSFLMLSTCGELIGKIFLETTNSSESVVILFRQHYSLLLQFSLLGGQQKRLVSVCSTSSCLHSESSHANVKCNTICLLMDARDTSWWPKCF